MKGRRAWTHLPIHRAYQLILTDFTVRVAYNRSPINSRMPELCRAVVLKVGPETLSGVHKALPFLISHLKGLGFLHGCYPKQPVIFKSYKNATLLATFFWENSYFS